ncbi:MAG TPA: hypothetical protein VJJ48_01045 [Candidatus Paceibacterota bacterium]
MVNLKDMSDIDKKTHKLATALYFVTSFFSDQEPLKWRLRSLSTELVSEGIKDKNMAIKEIGSLLNMAKSVGLVSETNYGILANEFSKVEFTLPEFLSLPEPKKEEIIKDNTSKIETVEKPVLSDFGAVSVKKNKRQSIIIALLKRKKEIMIKDATPLISGCSEKTVQRELGEMVASGILRKIGEKRWSRYTLA